MVGVARASIERMREPKVDIVRWDQFEHESAFFWMALDLPDWVDQVGMLTGSDAGIHLVGWRAIGRHFTFEEPGVRLSVHGHGQVVLEVGVPTVQNPDALHDDRTAAFRTWSECRLVKPFFL